MTVSWLQPPRALSWRATDSAVVLASITMLSPSWTRAAAAAPIRSFSSAWRRSRMSNAQLRPAPVDRDGPAVGPDQALLGLEDDEVLADRDGRDVEPGGQVARPGRGRAPRRSGRCAPGVRERRRRLGEAWRERSRLSSGADRGHEPRVSIDFRRTVDLSERNVKKAIETNRNMWQAIAMVRTTVPGRAARQVRSRLDPTRPADARTPPPPAPLHGAADQVGHHQRPTRTIEPNETRPDRSAPRGDGGRRDQQPGRRRGAASPADRAALVGLRQLRDPVQGLRPEGRAARPVREGRRRRAGPPLHRGRADASRSTSRGTGSTTTPSSPVTPPTSGSASGTINSNVFQDDDYMLGQRLQPRSARPPQGARPPPRLHRHHGCDRLARPEAVVRRRDELPRPGRHPRPPGPARRGARGRLRPARAGPADAARVQVLRAVVLHDGRPGLGHRLRPVRRRRAEGARSSSTPATTRRAPTSSSSSRRCSGPDRLGGFDFNSRFYADDDLMVGAADPFQLFRIMHEVVAGGRPWTARCGRRLHARPVPQHRAQDPGPDPLGDERPGGDREGAARRCRGPRGGAGGAATCSAPTPCSWTPSTPTSGRSSPRCATGLGLDPDPMAAYARSGYARTIVAERVGGQQAGLGRMSVESVTRRHQPAGRRRSSERSQPARRRPAEHELRRRQHLGQGDRRSTR